MYRIAILFSILIALFALTRNEAGETDVNISPLAIVSVNGSGDTINRDAPVPRRFYEVVADGFVDDQYVAEIPSINGVGLVELQFPWPVRVDRLLIIGWGGSGRGSITVTSLNHSQLNWRQPSLDWSVNKGRSAILQLVPPFEASTFRFEFRCDDPIVVNSIQCFSHVPRWKAALWVGGLQIVVPWCYGALWAAAVFGWGRLIYRNENPDASFEYLGRLLLVGLTAMTAASSVWLMIPDAWRHDRAEVIASLIMVGPSFLLISCRPSLEQKKLLIVLAATALLLLSIVAVESTVVANRRVKPMDHLFGLMTAQHLTDRLQVPDEMVLRPWMVPALAIPEVRLGGRFTYWIYLGQMAWINVLGLAIIASIAPRFGIKSVSAAAMIGLLPLTTAFHFPGQRVFVAGISLLAIDEWTRRPATNWWRWGAWAAGAAIFAHPGALFVLPGAAFYFLFVRPRSAAFHGILSVGIALAVYLAWVQFTVQQYPNVRNNLAFYPIMRTLEEDPPARNWREIIATLSQEHWRTLGENRIKQLRHYVWADNPWQTALYERMRAVSLTTTLGVVLSLIALLNLKRFGNGGWTWVAVVSPLVWLHLHIGQSFPQFHILPTPFFALAVIGIASMKQLGVWAKRLVVGESLLHVLFIPALLSLGLAGRFELPGWFAGDETSKLICLLPIAPWIVLASLALRREPDRIEN